MTLSIDSDKVARAMIEKHGVVGAMKIAARWIDNFALADGFSNQRAYWGRVYDYCDKVLSDKIDDQESGGTHEVE